MKGMVLKNKFNGQLCVNILNDSDILEGDIVEVKKSEIKKVSYVGVVGDLFHYGHLQSIKFAKSISDYLVCGIYTDDLANSYRVKPFANTFERKSVISSLKFVDKVITQEARDPTENLKKLHEEFPGAQIILVHGSDIKYVHGSEYVESIGGKVVQHPYYDRLSTFRMTQWFNDNHGSFKDIKNLTDYIGKVDLDFEDMKGNRTIISSKANTLKALQPLLKKSKIEDIYSFTVSKWKVNKHEILNSISKIFAPDKIIVRSSAVNEDTLDKSMAGHFESILDVESSNLKDVEISITKVISCYKSKNSESSFNQILVQRQTKNVAMSGVVFTRTLEKNAPYYVINYDDSSGETDTVTKGIENKMIIISHFVKKIPDKFVRLIDSIKELEELIPHLPLDVEFGLDERGQVVIFQVRPIAANANKNKDDESVREKLFSLQNKFDSFSQRVSHLVGNQTFFADMPDWNPAEIIGNNPNYLDYTLYDYIITDSAWHEARTSQGYYNVKPAKLVEAFGIKPYINVRNTFNSFTPASLSHTLREKLVNFYLDKLKSNPHLQDKVEFDILYTCYDLSFEKRSKELDKLDFSPEEINELKMSLIDLTNNLVGLFKDEVEKDMLEVFGMEERREHTLNRLNSNFPYSLIYASKVLLDDCRSKGTVPFSRLARIAFVAKSLLKSLVDENIVSSDFYDALLGSVSTVATKISEDFKKLNVGELSKEKFIKRYYHLRPGTYDITSIRYDSHPELLKSICIDSSFEKKSFNLDLATEQKINRAFSNNGLNFDAQHFVEFVRVAIESRELSKFEFTKNLSDALELIAQAGTNLGFTRNEMAQIDINDIFLIQQTEELSHLINKWQHNIKKRENEREICENLVLPPTIFSKEDFEIVKYYTAKPNFITRKNIVSKLINLSDENVDIDQIEGNVVLLENGDPGYDWIFTRNPAGLITKYGGVASHMAIRCAEFGIPAAIGCGDLIYDKLKSAKSVLINCKEEKIIPQN